MSYGMFNDILRLVGNPADAAQLLISDSNTRDLVVRRLFTDNKKSVEKFEELIDAYEIEILPTDVAGIVGWVADHCAHFLISTGGKMQNLEKKYKDELENAKASSDQSKSGSES